MLKATGEAWNCTFDDEFDSSILDTSKWSVVTTSTSGFHSGPECFVDSANNVSIANGILNLTVRKEDAPFVCASPSGNYTTQYTSGSVMTASTFSQTYGRFEARAAFPSVAIPGLQSTLWLFPKNSAKYGAWPWSGEIDFAEWYSKYSDRVIPYVHYVSSILDLHVTNNYCTITANQFHDYVVEWTPSTITVTFDGKTCISDSWVPYALTKPAPFDQPFFIALTQALGIGANAYVDGTTPLPATTQVDYMRVWS